jgi:nucleoside-diphosphate-sugar epimerase
VENALKESRATRVIHLAAMQLPFCKVNPVVGARVNVVGTVNIFEAAKRLKLDNVVYASSTAVYGLSEEYSGEPLANDALLKPYSHYGVYKQANEGNAAIYFQDDGISSTGLRPYVVYGAGRDQGITSTPTKAILAAAAVQPYRISFDDVPPPFPPEVDNRALVEAIGTLVFTSLKEGVAETLAIFRRALANGKIKTD